MAVSSRRNTFDQASWAGRRPMIAFVRGVTIDELRTVCCAEVLHGSGFPKQMQILTAFLCVPAAISQRRLERILPARIKGSDQSFGHEAGMRMNRTHTGQVALAQTPPGTAQRARRAWLPGRRSMLGLLTWLQNPPTIRGGSNVMPIDMSVVERVGRPYVIGPGTFLIAACFRSNLHGAHQPDALR